MCAPYLYVSYMLTAVPYCHTYALLSAETRAPGALDMSVQVFFDTLNVPTDTATLTDGWSYQPARRKAKPRARKGRTAAPSTTVLTIEEEAFWALPPPMPPGPEVVTT